MTTTSDRVDVIAAEIARLRPRLYRRFRNEVKLRAGSPLGVSHGNIRQLCPFDDPDESPPFDPLPYRR